MAKLFDFDSFDITGQNKLFHFLTDTGSASDIVISTPHMTDDAPTTGAPSVTAAPSGETGSFSLAGDDPFLKNLTKQTKENSESDLVLQSLMKSEEKNVEKRKTILGELPKIDTSLFIDKEFHLKKQLSLLRVVFALLITLGFGMYIFFFSELNPSGPLIGSSNIGAKLQSTSDSLKSVMTEVNFYRYRAAKEYLDQFFYQSNGYIQAYDAWKSADDSQKAELAAALEKAKGVTVTPFEKARDILSKQNYTVIYREQSLVQDATLDPTVAAENEKKLASDEFLELLKTNIADKKTQIQNELTTIKNGSDRDAKKQELRDTNELLQLVGNASLQKLIATDIRKMPNDQLRKFIISFSAKYDNRLAYIFQIKDKRVAWSTMVKEIYDKTEASDDRFKTKLFKDIGGIMYTGFDFDGTTGRLTISGSVKDFKGENFKILSILLDQLEGSRLFKDVEMRNFSKTFSEKDGFEGNFKIDLSLQGENEIDEKDKVLDLSNATPFFGDTSKLSVVPSADNAAPTVDAAVPTADAATPVAPATDVEPATDTAPTTIISTPTI